MPKSPEVHREKSQFSFVEGQVTRRSDRHTVRGDAISLTGKVSTSKPALDIEIGSKTSPKERARLQGKAKSAQKVTRKGSVISPEKKHKASVNSASEHLQNIPDVIEQDPENLGQASGSITVFEAGEISKPTVESVFGLEPVVKPEAGVESLDVLGSVENVASGRGRTKLAFSNYGKTARDLRE